MGRTRKPPQPSDNASIARALRSDSDLMRYSEWWVRRRIYGHEDEVVRWMINQYIASYKEILSSLPGAYDDEGRPIMAHRARLLAGIEREIEALSIRLTGHLDPAITDGFRQGYYGRAWLLDTVTVQEWNVSQHVLLPTEQIRALVYAEYVGLDDWISLQRDELTNSIKRSLTASMISGEGMQKAARRLRNELGAAPGQTRDYKGAAYKTLLIARTEIMRASNLGALAVYEQNQDILKGWEWVATLDERTCFPAWVKVLTPDGEKQISQVEVGDTVLTRCGSKRVKAIARKQYFGKMIRVEAGHLSFVSTADHLVWTTRGWKEAGLLQVNDTLQTVMYELVKVTRVVDLTFAEADHSPFVTEHIGVASGIFFRILMPVVTIGLNCYAFINNSKINAVASEAIFLLKRYAKSIQAFTYLFFKSCFAFTGAITRKRTVNRINAGSITEVATTGGAHFNVGRSPALFGTIPNIAALCSKVNAAALTLPIQRVSRAASYATDGISILSGSPDHERFAAGFTRFFNRISGISSKIASSRTILAFRLACGALVTFSAVLASFYGMGAAFGSLIGMIALTVAILTIAPSRFKRTIAVFTDVLVSHKPIVSQVATHSQGEIIVYDIEVEDAHEFYANGILVHNCIICGRLDGKVFPFGSRQEQPPSGSHPGCRCTVMPVLIDEELMERVGGVREHYGDWAARTSIVDDGGLSTQRSADAHGLNQTQTDAYKSVGKHRV